MGHVARERDDAAEDGLIDGAGQQLAQCSAAGSKLRAEGTNDRQRRGGVNKRLFERQELPAAFHEVRPVAEEAEPREPCGRPASGEGGGGREGGGSEMRQLQEGPGAVGLAAPIHALRIHAWC